MLLFVSSMSSRSFCYLKICQDFTKVLLDFLKQKYFIRHLIMSFLHIITRKYLIIQDLLKQKQLYSQLPYDSMPISKNKSNKRTYLIAFLCIILIQCIKSMKPDRSEGLIKRNSEINQLDQVTSNDDEINKKNNPKSISENKKESWKYGKIPDERQKIQQTVSFNNKQKQNSYQLQNQNFFTQRRGSSQMLRLLTECAIWGCIECSSSTSCEKCEIGYVLLGGNCVKDWYYIPSNCYLSSKTGTYSRFRCKSCFSGYALDKTQGTCSQCEVPNCLYCLVDNLSRCNWCDYGFYLSSSNTSCLFGDCKISGCSECSSSTSCGKCQGGYILARGICFQQNLYPSNCDYAKKSVNSSLYNCTECTFGYDLNKTQGKCYKCQVQNCLRCSIDHLNECQYCYLDFYVSESNTSCIRYDCAIQGCSQCYRMNICGLCQDGYLPNNDSCSKPNQHPANCGDVYKLIEYSLYRCLSCIQGYFLTATYMNAPLVGHGQCYLSQIKKSQNNFHFEILIDQNYQSFFYIHDIETELESLIYPNYNTQTNKYLQLTRINQSPQNVLNVSGYVSTSSSQNLYYTFLNFNQLAAGRKISQKFVVISSKVTNYTADRIRTLNPYIPESVSSSTNILPIIIGIIAGVVVVIVVVVVIFCCFCKKKKADIQVVSKKKSSSASEQLRNSQKNFARQSIDHLSEDKDEKKDDWKSPQHQL